MAYEKQNFTPGQKLKAEHLNHVEAGVEAAQNAAAANATEIEVLKTYTDNLKPVLSVNDAEPDENGNVALEMAYDYVFTGTYHPEMIDPDLDPDNNMIPVTLGEEYKWSDLQAALAENRNVRCVLFNSSGRFPIYLDLVGKPSTSRVCFMGWPYSNAMPKGRAYWLLVTQSDTGGLSSNGLEKVDLNITQDWNNIEGKPFVTTGSDTLYWDGNTEGLLEVEVPDCGKYYKMSDVVLTEEEMYCESENCDEYMQYFEFDYGGGYGLTRSNDELEAMFADLGVGIYGDVVFCALTDNYQLPAFGATLPEKGIYFGENVRSFYLRNFTRFNAQEKIAPSHLYQPDWEQMDESRPDFIKNKPFGEMPTGGDTLYWDGNTEGLLEVDVPDLGTFFKVSDVALSKEDVYCEDRAGIPIARIEALNYECSTDEELASMTDDILRNLNGPILSEVVFPKPYEYPLVCYAEHVFCVFEDNVEIGRVGFPQKGIYFRSNRYLQIAGCTKFPITKLMDKKYLPLQTGVYLKLGEVSGDEETGGEIPNFSEELRQEIYDAVENGRLVRCELEVGGIKTIFTLTQDMNGIAFCTAYDVNNHRPSLVALNYDNGSWAYVPDVSA